MKFYFIQNKTKQAKTWLSIYDIEIYSVNEVLFLGVILDEHLSWKSQIQNVARTGLSKSVWALLQIEFLS